MQQDSVHSWKVYNPSGGYLTAWQDTARPSYTVRADGVSDLTLSLPWLSGVGSQTARRRIAWGNRVDLQVTTRATQTGGTPALYGQAQYGSARYGVALGLSRTVGRWLVRSWVERPPVGVEVVLIPLSSVADEPLPVTLTLTGCPAQLAKAIVTDYTPALAWDSGNPALCDATPVNGAVFDGSTPRQVLEALAPLSGVGWFVAFTADGRVRFRQQPTVAVHRVTVGHTGVDPVLTYDGIERRKEVIVRWQGGETAPVKASDWTSTDPRRERITREDISTEGDALRLATLTLAARDTLDYRGSVTLVRPQAIEDLHVGDGLSLARTDGSPTASAAVYGQAVYGQSTYGGGVYGGGVLAVGEISVDGLDRATVTLAKPRPDIRGEIARLSRRVETLRAQVA